MRNIVSFMVAVVTLFSPWAYALDWTEFNASVVVEVRREAGIFTCSGVAITPRTVLTAAHCMHDVQYARVSTEMKYDAYGSNFVAVAEGGIHINPGYSPEHSLYSNDVAALDLTQSLAGVRVVPILPIGVLPSEGERLETIGFGGREGINLRTWSDVIFESSQAGTIFTRDALCVMGDSGGPLYYRYGASLFLVGIHSTKIMPVKGDAQGVAVDLRGQTDWLQSVVR